MNGWPTRQHMGKEWYISGPKTVDTCKLNHLWDEDTNTEKMDSFGTLMQLKQLWVSLQWTYSNEYNDLGEVNKMKHFGIGKGQGNGEPR